MKTVDLLSLTDGCWVLVFMGAVGGLVFLWVAIGQHTYNRVIFSAGKIVASSYDRTDSMKSCRRSALSPRHPVQNVLPDESEFPAWLIRSHYFLAHSPSCSISMPLLGPEIQSQKHDLGLAIPAHSPWAGVEKLHPAPGEWRTARRGQERTPGGGAKSCGSSFVAAK